MSAPAIASAVHTRVIWRVFWRRDHKSAWMEWDDKDSEAEARELLAYVRREYAHYEVELRKITITEEVES